MAPHDPHPHDPHPLTDVDEHHPVSRRVHAWNEAITTNDPDAIADFITDDWVLIDPAGGIIPAERFLDVVASGQLRHDVMTHRILRLKDHGDVVIETSRSHNSGSFQGAPLEANEWVTCVWVRDRDTWRCSLTHLSPIGSK